ncbi:hypothetical protein DPMN_026600 [Dreissena polymorpha]|uniref:Uncharacterized protein n=1 Tax=Dreissena polymorpha TaxID=45954 RepID=A0A9D4REH0_DREPO|nr:hypothetical protein DPMN_026600 [Dreissena polymorpha]
MTKWVLLSSKSEQTAQKSVEEVMRLRGKKLQPTDSVNEHVLKHYDVVHKIINVLGKEIELAPIHVRITWVSCQYISSWKGNT